MDLERLSVEEELAVGDCERVCGMLGKGEEGG